MNFLEKISVIKKCLNQAHDFHIASGKFQVLQKKEEFESYFRTPGFGGYHLLQLVRVLHRSELLMFSMTLSLMWMPKHSNRCKVLVFLYYVLIS